MDTKFRNIFFLKAIDPTTQSIALEERFEVKDRSELLAMLGMEYDELSVGRFYDLDPAEVVKIVSNYRLTFEPGSMPVELHAWHPTDDRPYKIHTRRELALMLSGTKPLASFMDAHPAVTDDNIIPEKEFQPYVTSGRIIKREHIEPPPPSARPWKGQLRGSRRVLYAMRGEEWRIDALLLLWKTSALSGWSEGFERMEGSLLGYEDWQNDFHIAEQKARKSRTEPSE